MPTTHQKFKNNARSILNGTLAVGGVTMNVATGQGGRFPSLSAGEYAYITLYEKDTGGNEINYEIAKMSAISGDTMTLVRDIEGIVVTAGGTSGGWAYPSSSSINPSQVVYVELRYTAFGAGNNLTKDGNLEGLESVVTTRSNLGLGSMATQAASSVAITGGTISGVAVTGATITATDSLSTFADNGDATKQMRFEMAGITTGQTRILTVPDSNGTLATIDSVQTFTNKTIGSATNTITGTQAGLTAGNVTTNANLTGEVTSSGNATTVANSAVIGKVLTGYASAAGTVAATDTILQAVNKLNGNDATRETAANKDASGGYAGLTQFKLNLKNAANTFTNFLTNATTAARTWTMPDKDGTVAMTSDITGTNSGTNTGDNATNTQYSGLAASKADIASPSLTGTPSAPTAAPGTSTTQIATTAFVGTEKETLPSISKSLHIGAIVKAIIYDTSKDSDGGAWRKRCTDKSWYTETLGGDRWIGQQATIAAAWTAAGSATGAIFQASATAGPLTSGKYYAATSATTATEVFRGISREFPAQVAIVAETARVVIYDLTQVGTPMWMVVSSTSFVSSSAFYEMSFSSSGKCLDAINGLLIIGTTNGSNSLLRGGSGVYQISFISDALLGRSCTTEGVNTSQQYGIGYRATLSTYKDESLSSIVDGRINAVAVTVLSDAPIDSVTRLPVPTIYVGTGAGVSRIADNGTVSSTASAFPVYSVWIGRDFVGASGGSTAKEACMLSTKISLPTGGGNWLSTYWPYWILTGTSAPHGAASYILGSKNAIATPLGVYRGIRNNFDITSSIYAAITNDYNSGWMNGDIRGAWLADTVAETVSGAELLTNAGNWSTNAPASLTVNSATSITYLGTYGSWHTAAYTFGVSTKSYVLEVTWSGLNPVYANMYFGVPGLYYAVATTVSGSFRVQLPTGYTYVYVNSQGSCLATINFSVKEASTDRSVKANPLTVVGTLTKAAVASGAQLMAYSGFSAANYLEQPYSANLDFGTGTWSFMVQGTFVATAVKEVILCRDSATTGVLIRLQIDVTTSYLSLTAFDGTTTRTATGTTAVDDGNLKTIVCTYSAGTLNIYVNGTLYATATGAALNTLNNATGLFRVGVDCQAANPLSATSKIALLRASATAPSADQIAHIYRTELPLFQANAKCTIDGTSTAVSALAYDEATDLLQVGTSWGRTSFKDLVRVDSEATTTGALTSLSANQGAILTGGTSAKYYQPAMLLRDELRREDEARKALGKVPVFIEFDAVTSQVAFVVTKGYTVKAVYSAGTLKRIGSTKDYTISNDGFQETITFAVAPGNGVWVSALCVRSN